ncbi:MAG: hypothetical protein M1144_03505 [Candidatus Thermoplasmatota archaeon]|nr:hypothetical protein [Candidatus Thermoplasmatota archaeon]
MSLFSDVDWLILLLAGAVLLLGGDNRELLRTAGRMYAKVMRLRDEFLSDLRETGSTPAPAATAPSPSEHPGIWSVGTARPVSALPAEESQRSLAKLTGGTPDPRLSTPQEAKSA